MKADATELLFPSRGDFRAWLQANAETSGGVWLVFGKTKAVATLSANDALEESLCFGWIDGQMQRIDDTKYVKYFAPRRAKSPWSEKNKKTVASLREKGIMTASGEKAIEAAKKNGIWDAEPIGDRHIEAFAEKLKGTPPAYERFTELPPSGRLMYTRRHHSFKGEEARQRDFAKILAELANRPARTK